MAAVCLMLLTGFRRMEVLGLERLWFNRKEHIGIASLTPRAVRKSGSWEKLRWTVSSFSPGGEGWRFVFPADWGDGHFIGVVRILDRVCFKAKLKESTRPILRHTFASVAGDLGFSELTIAGLLGHSARRVTQGYVHLDTALVVAADHVSAEIGQMLDGGVAVKDPKRRPRSILQPQ